MNRLITAILLALVSSSAFGFDCNSDCGRSARFKYACPTFNDPFRKCYGRDPVTYAACESDKAISCRLWDSIYKGISGQAKAMMQSEFNRDEYDEAKRSGEEAEYMALCQSAAVAACTAIGAEYGATWGAVLSGAGGVFIANRICKQSQKW